MGLSQKIKMFTIRFFSVPVVTRFKENCHVVSLLATRIPSAAWAVGQSSWGLANEWFFFPLPLPELRLYALLTDSDEGVWFASVREWYPSSEHSRSIIRTRMLIISS